MDFRIENSRVGNAENARAEQANTLAVPAPAKINRPTDGDRVEISDISEAMRSVSDDLESRRAERVKALGALHRSGQYQPDLEKVAKAVISVALEAKTSAGME